MPETSTENTIDRPTTGSVEERQATAVAVDGRRLRGVIPYGVESRDMGSWREVIEPGALRAARLDDLVATVDHAGVPIGRHPGTLELEDRADGLHWSVTPPESRADVREAVERGDLRAGSWRMVVGRDEWRGDVRHVHEIAELRDVAVVTAPAYPGAKVEFRSAPESENANNGAERQKEGTMPDTDTGAAESRDATETTENTTEATEQRTEPEERAGGGLQVEDRAGGNTGSLLGLFESRGWPGEAAEVSFDEFRTATFTGSVDTLSPARQDGVGLGQDTRYAFPAFPQMAVGSDVTAVQVLRQSARTLPSAANVVRAIDAVTAKPEVATGTAIVTVSLNQVAAIETNIPNVILDQPAIEPLIQTDLRLALNEGLDKLILDAVAASGFQAPGTDPLLISIRKAMTTIQGDGYAPDTVILTPANAEALDTLRATADAAEQFYVFPAAGLAPRSVYGLNVRISKTIAAPVVADSRALGKLYVSPIELARFEADAGTTNRSNVRLEGHAAFGVERQDAAVRIAAS